MGCLVEVCEYASLLGAAGTCDGGSCVCPPGFHGKDDYEEFASCHVNKTVQTTFYTISMVLGVTLLVHSLVGFLFLLQHWGFLRKGYEAAESGEALVVSFHTVHSGASKKKKDKGRHGSWIARKLSMVKAPSVVRRLTGGSLGGGLDRSLGVGGGSCSMLETGQDPTSPEDNIPIEAEADKGPQRKGSYRRTRYSKIIRERQQRTLICMMLFMVYGLGLTIYYAPTYQDNFRFDGTGLQDVGSAVAVSSLFTAFWLVSYMWFKSLPNVHLYGRLFNIHSFILMYPHFVRMATIVNITIINLLIFIFVLIVPQARPDLRSVSNDVVLNVMMVFTITFLSYFFFLLTIIRRVFAQLEELTQAQEMVATQSMMMDLPKEDTAELIPGTNELQEHDSPAGSRANGFGQGVGTIDIILKLTIFLGIPAGIASFLAAQIPFFKQRLHVSISMAAISASIIAHILVFIFVRRLQGPKHCAAETSSTKGTVGAKSAMPFLRRSHQPRRDLQPPQSDDGDHAGQAAGRWSECADEGQEGERVHLQFPSQETACGRVGGRAPKANPRASQPAQGSAMASSCNEALQGQLSSLGMAWVPECSGHGSCVNGTCICDAGWTGKSDLIDTEGLDCQIHEQGLKIAWGVTSFVIGLMVLISLPKLAQRWEDFVATQRRKRAQKHDFRIYHSPIMLSNLCFYVVALPWGTAFVATRIAFPSWRVGTDMAPTLFLFMASAGFFCALFFFQTFLLHTFLTSSSSLRVLVPLSYAFASYNLLLSCACAAAPFVPTVFGASPSQPAAKIAFVTYYFGFAVAFIGFVLQAVYILGRAKSILGITDPKAQSRHLIKVRDAVTSVQRHTIVSGVVLGSLYLVFVGWAFLWNKTDYLLPAAFLVANIVWRHIAETAVQRPQTSGSSLDFYADPMFKDTTWGALTLSQPDSDSRTKSQGSAKSATRSKRLFGVGGEPGSAKQNATNQQNSNGDLDDDEDLIVTVDPVTNPAVAKSTRQFQKRMSTLYVQPGELEGDDNAV
ncbi:Hypothetical protein SCF082_LOCUS49578 [Durusdinium trenchii]|uniref:EGF-like domain-containing protein n=1 Tax=Durusdinium trenchii TaxID=1381693 RepID=A0ABP0S291_9DINO